jgi:hypothetical protein
LLHPVLFYAQTVTRSTALIANAMVRTKGKPSKPQVNGGKILPHLRTEFQEESK